MATKHTIIKVFNSQFLEFISDIYKVFPKDNDIKTSHFYIKNVINLTPTLLIKMWNTYVTNCYKEKIEKGDFNFFLSKDYKDDVHDIKNNDELMLVIQSLKKKARMLSKINKKKVIKYIQNLTKLSSLYFKDK